MTEAATSLLRHLPHGRERAFGPDPLWKADEPLRFLVSTNDLLAPPACGRVEFKATAPSLYVRPTEPHQIDHPFDVISLYTLPSSTLGETARIVVEYADPEGHLHEASEPFGPAGEWTLHWMRVPGIESAGASLVAIRLDGIPSGASPLLLDGLAFFQSRSTRRPEVTRPSPPFALQEGRPAGLHRGEGVLPFPNNPAGMCPPAAQEAGWNELIQTEDYFDFVHHSDAGELRARLRPLEKERRLELIWNESPFLLPMEGFTLGKPLSDPQTLDVRRVDHQVWIRDSSGGEYMLSMTGRVLRVDISAVISDKGEVGWERLPQGVRPLTIPFLDAGRNAQLPVWTFDAASPASHLFAGVWFDLTRSAATRMETVDGASRMRYEPPFGMARNKIFETLWLAISPNPLDVLPAVPTTNRVDVLQGWRSAYAATDMEAAAQLPQGIRATWINAGRRPLRAALDTSPFSSEWMETVLAFAPDGQFQRTASRHYRIKPAILLQENRASSMAVPDANSVWGEIDFDPRCAGSATFLQNWLLMGEWLQQSKPTPEAPAISGGEPGWLLSGIAGAGFARTPISRLTPFLPLATQTRLNASSLLFAPGLDEMVDFPIPAGADAVDILTATALAYGMAARVVHIANNPVATLRSFEMVRHIQRHFCVSPTHIFFWDGTRMQSLPRALQSGAWRQSQLYMQMPCGLEVWVNGHAHPWEIRQGRETRVLPPFGHLAVCTTDGFRQMSLVEAGQRMDYIEDGRFRFFAPRAPGQVFEGIRSDQPILLHVVENEIELIWPDKAAPCEIPASWLAGARLDAGIGEASVQPRGDRIRITPREKTTRSIRWPLRADQG